MSDEQQQPPPPPAEPTPSESAASKPSREGRSSREHLVTIAIVIALALLLALIYAPLLIWLGRTTLQLDQLHNGGLIVLFALVIGLRRIIRKKRLEVDISRLGLVLVIAGLACLLLVRWAPGLALIFALVSFCLSFAGLSAFLFGSDGVKNLLPAIVGVLLLGILAGLAPGLDWPLRGTAARYSGAVLQQLGMNVQVAIEQGAPPRLLLGVKDRVFVVASECNGFGLLTSSIVIAAVLGFYYELSWREKIGLLLLSVPLAIAFNALRIVGISISAVYTPLPYMLIHEGVGLGFYVAALMLLWWLAHRRSLGTNHERRNSTTTQTELGLRSQELLELAKRQKQIIWMIFLSLVTMFIPFATIVTGIIQIYFIFKLAQAIRSSGAWIYIILAFIPLIGLIALLHINGKATKTLQANGVKVGLMGAKSSDLEKIKGSA